MQKAKLSTQTGREKFRPPAENLGKENIGKLKLARNFYLVLMMRNI